MKKTFIIEHLEPTIGKWCLLEYQNISKIVGKNNLVFTNITKSLRTCFGLWDAQNSNTLDKNFDIKTNSTTKKLSKFGKVIPQSVRELKLQDYCILDPEAKITLTPKIAGKYKYFIFGGILGDFPPKKRTRKELTRFLNAKSYNIGKEQMPTDNAIAVVWAITKGRPLSKMKFQDTIEIIKNNNKGIQESYILPYRYLIKNKKPLISKEIIRYLKRKRGF